MKQYDTQFEKDARIDSLFIAADKHDEQMKVMAEQTNGYFNKEVTDEILPDWMKNNDSMYETEPEEWTGYTDPDDLPAHWDSGSNS